MKKTMTVKPAPNIYFYCAKREGRDEIKKKIDEMHEKIEAYKAELAEKVGDKVSAEDLSKLHEMLYEIAMLNFDFIGSEVGHFHNNFLIPFFDYEEKERLQEIEISRLKELIQNCDVVLRDMSGDSANLHLPTPAGLCDNTDYDGFYYDSVDIVKDWAKKALEFFEERKDYMLLMWCRW